MFHSSLSIGPSLTRLKAHLEKERYGAAVARRYVAVAHRFLLYLQRRSIDVQAAQPQTLCSYVRNQLQVYRRHHGRDPADMRGWRWSETSGIHMLLRLVQGGWPPKSAPVNEWEDFHQQVCHEYGQWLSDVRGLSAVTVSDRRERAARFLRWLGERGTQRRLFDLTLAEVDAYLESRSAVLRRPSCKGLATCLRSFLRYLYTRKLIARDLAAAVSGPTLYAFASIPSALRAEDVAAVLDTARKDHSPIGLRDYAVLMLLSAYGLRAGEVVRLCLEDIDWRHDRVRVRHSKTGGESVLPLLTPVGDALLEYLRHGRPETQAREIFVRMRAPFVPLRDGSSLYSTVARRLLQAGVCTPGKHGPHAFRHARAVSLLRAAVPVKTIGDILGHRSTDSTAVYLKLATEDLRGVGLEVPEEVKP